MFLSFQLSLFELLAHFSKCHSLITWSQVPEILFGNFGFKRWAKSPEAFATEVGKVLSDEEMDWTTGELRTHTR